MKRVMVLCIAVVFLAVAGVVMAAPADTAAPAVPEGEIMIKAPEMKKPPVPFKHATHAQYECSKCHHTWNGEGAPKKCTACHGMKKEGKKLDIKEAAHQSCRGCHRDMKKAGEKTGPTPCSGCHKK